MLTPVIESFLERLALALHKPVFPKKARRVAPRSSGIPAKRTAAS